MTIRLVDYVAIVGFDFEAHPRNGKGRIIQRFPEKDWPDTSFIEGIELFCQPLGWRLTQNSLRYLPQFHQFVLTDIDVDRHYCACLTFYEQVQGQSPSRQLHQQQQYQQQQHNHHEQQHLPAALCAPKSIVLISRLNCQEVFKSCLSIFYAVHVDNLRYSLETLFGNLLSTVRVPLYGGPEIRFSLSAGDYLALQPPKTDTIPVTSNTVYRLIEDLGVHNVILLFYALLTEHKILFYSQSYTRLNEACQGLIALMYPFKYSHTYIPILPANLIEFLSTPTPFIIGVHSSLKREISDLLDAIIVDIDICSVKVPDSLHVAHLEEPYNSLLETLLVQISKPQIIHRDDAFKSPCQDQPSSPDLMDKEIRATFLRTITQILQGYRSCLTVIRIHPKSLISFHKASFLGQRGFADNEFMTRLLDSMFFEKFVESRGLPFRDCDLFDELHATLHERLQEEKNDMHAIVRHIKNLAHSLWEQENPNSRPPNQKALKPTDENANRIVSKPFPLLDGGKIAEIIASGSQRRISNVDVPSSEIENATLSDIRCQSVPLGLTAEQVKSEFNANEFVINSARRLEVMKNCVNCIFDNKISDARKALPAVLKALKNKANRLALIDELACHLGSQRAVLEHQQFDLVVRLMNCALQHESQIDLNGVAAKILPLAMEFCKRLCTGVIQFAYTCIQDHPVWSNQQFWESSFYLDVEKYIIALYGNTSDTTRSMSAESDTANDLSNNIAECGLKSFPSSSSIINKTVTTGSQDNLCCESGLEIASKQLQLLEKLPEEKRKELTERRSQDEESIVYTQAVHYANTIVCMKVPFDIATRTTKSGNSTTDHLAPLAGNLSQGTHSNGSWSDRNTISDEESGYEDENNFSNSEVVSGVVKFVSRFVDRVCIDSCVGDDHIKALHVMIPQVVAMQIETLESVYRESKRQPPVTKPKITNPDLIEGEEIVTPALRAYLLPDGRDKDDPREESIGAHIGGPVFLPAEGGIFITNYRVIFKGRPCDPFYCEQTVVRSFPVAALTKEKRITIHEVPAVDQKLHEGLQLRSSTFQLIRIAFDEEVTSESIENFRKHVNRQKSPLSMFQLFAFTSQINAPNKSMILPQKNKVSKSATIKSLKRSFMQKTGLKKKDTRFPDVVWTHTRTQAMLMRSVGFQSKGALDAFRKSNQIIYVMTHKSIVKNVKPDMHRCCVFIPVDLHEAKQVKGNFAKFLRACVPSGPEPNHKSEASLSKTIESLEWFEQLKSIMECSNKIVDLMDEQGKSVLLAIEDGWDLTSQITSIAQLCLNPYYRTLDGFRALIEKEWLAFGQRSPKSTHTNATHTSGFGPIFLQFLDLVHQIHRQFPQSFQFNQYYLKFLAYHHVSCRFKTFLQVCEPEKPDGDWSNEEAVSPAPSLNSFGLKSTYNSSSGTSSSSNNSTSNMNLNSARRRQSNEASDMNAYSGGLESSRTSSSTLSSYGNNSSVYNTIGASFWDYAEKQGKQQPIFFNYQYTPVGPTEDSVIKPNSHMALLKLWDYYTSEDLLHGPSYDVEVFNMSRQHQEELQASSDQSKASKRRVVVTNYDCVHLTQPDGLTQIMGELKNIESEYNLNPTPWSSLWSKIETSLPVD